MNLRDQLAPLIRKAGVTKVARKSGIAPSTLSEWINGAVPRGSKGPRRLGDGQLESLVAALGLEINIYGEKRHAAMEKTEG